MAIMFERTEVVRLLMEAGADIEAKDEVRLFDLIRRAIAARFERAGQAASLPNLMIYRPVFFANVRALLGKRSSSVERRALLLKEACGDCARNERPIALHHSNVKL